ncbi:TPA: hypothetical protein QCR51_004877 [Bacillus cereus]|nr:hypothetical protein [Bacillus cereus]
MEFIIELLKETAKGIIREGSAYFFRKQFLDKENVNNEKILLVVTSTGAVLEIKDKF